MTFVERHDPLWETLRDIAVDEGLSLYDVERLGAMGLRISISRLAAETAGSSDPSTSDSSQGGVTSGDCSRLCRRLMVFFTAKGEEFGLTEEPEIEVCSPGVNRTLRLEEHFSKAVGERVKLHTRRGFGVDSGADGDDKQAVIGVIQSVNGPEIAIAEEGSGKEFVLRVEDVKKARVDFKF